MKFSESYFSFLEIIGSIRRKEKEMENMSLSDIAAVTRDNDDYFGNGGQAVTGSNLAIDITKQ